MSNRTGKRFGFGIIGGGVIAPFHARAIGELPNARLVAVADVIEEQAATTAAKFGVEALGVEQLLARPDIDVVSVCVPSGHHAEVGIEVARAGKHVAVEKPIDVTLEAADRLIDACREQDVKLTVISQHRFDPGMMTLRQLVDEGRLGRLILGDAVVKWYRTQQYYDSGAWRGTRALDGGGALMNQGVHSVDMLQWIMGPVERVFARCRTAAHQRIEVEDIAVAVLSFASGAVGVLEASTAVFPGLPERIEITGTDGTVIVQEGRLRVRQLKDEQGETEPYGSKLADGADPGAGGAADPTAISHAGHRVQLADLLDAIETGREPLIDGPEARRPLEIILAVYESARTGRDVSLPLAVSKSS